ncbi:MAG: FHIPEP family type III secretion protein, partial [Kordiimonadaceae bacterium]|nr:FHIPEP family type III secretion protein [Kordiimonadaceae bacterium]
MSDSAPSEQAKSDAPVNIGGIILSGLKSSDVSFALGMVSILLMLFVPIPSWLLDIMLAASITFSIMVLMTVLFVEKPLHFNSFPTVLLVATMLRLSLNIGSTRLILSEGHKGSDAAGEVIEAFGLFLMGGQVIIGVIIFSILVIVNFVVITKGSGRIAEVAARFSLDSMPGKQMAIDADMSAGLINETEAVVRRKELEDESTFFGAMDGAAKFVRGDAIAGLLITVINIVGGIIIGVVINDLTFAEAGSRYTMLTIGDGLVSQIPALIVSLAAGMLVTKAGLSGSTDKALFGQLSGTPRGMGVGSGLLFAMALMPGIPFLPFA